MTLSTISTGAFPVGLAYREFDQNQFNDDYIKSVTKRIIHSDFSKENPDVDDEIELKNLPKDFESITIDGGAINNEPYNEVVSIVKGKHYDKNKDYRSQSNKVVRVFGSRSKTIHQLWLRTESNIQSTKKTNRQLPI